MDPELVYKELYDQLLILLSNDYSEKNREVSYQLKLKLALQYFNRTEKGVLFIVLEDLQLLYGRNWMKLLLQFPVNSWKNIRLCGTVNVIDQRELVNADTWNMTIIPVTFLQMREKKDIIIKMFSQHSKQLSPQIIDALCYKKNSGFPEYLTLVMRSMLLLEERDWKEAVLNYPPNTIRPGDRIAASLKKYIDTIPDDMGQLYNYLYYRSVERANSTLVKCLLEILNTTTFGLREKDLKEIIAYKTEYSEFEFYYTFIYLSFLLSKDHLGRYTTNSSAQAVFKNEPEYRDLLIDYIKTLPVNDTIRCNELAFLYATKSQLKDCLIELAKCHNSTVERQIAFEKLLENYSHDLYTFISDLELDDINNYDLLFNLLSQITSVGVSQRNIKYQLAELVVSKCLEVNDLDLNIIHKYGIFSCASYIALKTGHHEKAQAWADLAKTYLVKNQSVCLPVAIPEITDIFNATKTHLVIMEEINRTRKCLDLQLPESLCMYALESVKNKIDQVMDTLKHSILGTIGISLIGLTNSLSLYYEMMGDLLMRMDNKESSKEFYIIGEEIERGFSNGPSRNHAALLQKIGVLCIKDGDPQEALNYYQQAYDELVQIYDPDNRKEIEINLALTICRIAEAKSMLGNFKDAFRHLVKARVIFEKEYNKSNTIQSAQDLAVCLFKIGELAKTADDWKEEGRESVLLAAKIMYTIAKETQNDEWIDKLQICINLYNDLEE